MVYSVANRKAETSTVHHVVVNTDIILLINVRSNTAYKLMFLS